MTVARLSCRRLAKSTTMQGMGRFAELAETDAPHLDVLALAIASELREVDGDATTNWY